jgi:hypothetical protein
MRALEVNRFGIAILVGAIAAGGAVAGAQDGTKAIPDAQIESNVLRALAGAPELSTQNIQTSTVYGTVTLSGNVHDETLRVKAENLAARAEGVKKVVDQLTLGDTPPPAPAEQAQGGDAAPAPDAANPPAGQVLMSDGTYAPAPVDDQAAPQQAQNEPAPPTAGAAPNGDPNQGPPPPRRPMYQNYAQGPAGPAGPQGGQQAGLAVTVPAGAPLQIRINRGLDSQHIQPGTPFDGMVLNDVAAGGAIAIPRGALVQGVVLDAKKAGVLKGHGDLALQINSVTLGGTVYPISTEVWQREGKDKTASTVNNAVGLGALGAVVGALAGGGAGAAIGAGVGGAAGVANSAASPRGQIIIPPESVLNFKTAAAVTVKTVSQQEMTRLAYAAGPVQPARPPVRRRYYSPYYGYYYGPGM